MNDDGDMFRELRQARQKARALYGQPCPECLRLLPKASPSILLPQQRCKIHGYRDTRPRTAETQYLTLAAHGESHAASDQTYQRPEAP